MRNNQGFSGFRALFAAATIFTFLMHPVSANASEATAGHVSNIVVNSSGTVFFQMSGTRTSAPSCQTAGNRWVFNGSTSGGQALLAALMSAYGLNKQITVYGTGTCLVWADTESVEYIHIQG